MKIQKQILYCFFSALILLLSENCKSRNAKWREALNAQMAKEKDLLPLDTSIYGFMLSYHVPAMSVTVGKDSSIIYSKTFGLANLSKQEPADTESTFRIIGLSTAITSLAVSKLIQQGKISYDSKVFGEGGILSLGYAHQSIPAFTSEITIADLLRMESGGWSGADDYMINHKLRAGFANKDSAISWVLDDTAKRQKPGTVVNFSFTGFFILGKVIEKLTGEPYEKWIKENILSPIGIKRMQIANEESKIPHEVTYYNDQSWPIYNGEIDENLHMAKADAAIGWIATSSDLVRLMQACKQIDSSRKNKIFPSIKSANNNQLYFPDWTYVADTSNWWLQFLYYGSSSVLVKSSKRYYWAVLINTYRPVEENEFFNDLDSLINGAMRNPDIISGSKKRL
jgi:CubicO group peptidase (beta-lactamase class C family)